MSQPDRLPWWYSLLPVLAVAFVFFSVNELRDQVQLTSPAVSFYNFSIGSDSLPQELLERRPDCKAKAPLSWSVAPPELPAGSRILVADLSGRLQLSAAAAVFIVAFVTLLCLCGLYVHRSLRRPLRTRDRVLCSFAALLIAGVFVWLIFSDRRAVALLLKSFDCLAAALFAKTTVGLSEVDRIVGALSVLSAAIIPVTVALLLNGVSSTSEQLADLRMRCAALRTTLAAGATVLAAAVIVARVLQGWVLGFLPDSDQQALRAVADNWTMAIGTYWTLVLVAAYVPAAIIAHHFAIKMADTRQRAPDDKRTRDQWMEDEGLNVTLKGQVARILMMLAPWLSGGPLAEIGKQFLG
jgi:hypothetical protein